MATIHVCDECGDQLRTFALRVEPTSGLGDDGGVLFLEGSWNGGTFCTVACARRALAKILDPSPDPDEDRDGFTAAG